MMMLLVLSAILASLAMGVTCAYGLCCAMFALFRIHVRAHQPNMTPMQVKTAQS